jgi:hypothetical protein
MAIEKRKLPDYIVKQLPPNFGQKKSKYGSKRVEFDGIKFHSQKECSRYKVLKMLFERGEIRELNLQVKFELKVNEFVIEKYIADFTYYDKQGKYIVEDTKGFKTADYKRKKKWMKNVLGIEIFES